MNAIEFSAGGRRWRADLDAVVDLSIPLAFDGVQPRFFTDTAAVAEPLRSAGFSGLVSQGASCNCALYTLAPHCHGTHTECVGHVTADGANLATRTPCPPAPALLVTVNPEGAGEAADRIIERRHLETAAATWAALPWTALVVRTLPNGVAKRQATYSGPAPAAWFAPDAMRWIVERNVTSLVVDLPSLDRADDGGRLAAHRLYWGLPTGSVESREATRGQALVTELAYVPDTVRDGFYLLDLQVASFATDAAPSRPVLYAAQELTVGPQP
jgi:kynurenine formamidase